MSPLSSEVYHELVASSRRGVMEALVVVQSCVFKEPWPGDAVEFSDDFARLFHTNLAFPAPTALLSLKTPPGLYHGSVTCSLQLCSDLQI